MNNINLPPFYVGQKVVAVINHSQGYFKKGDEFIIKNVVKNKCACGYCSVDVGIISKLRKTECFDCRVIFNNDGFCLFDPTAFRPLQQSKFPLMTFTQIKQKEQTEILIDN